MDILYLVDRLENLIASSRKMPLINQIIIKESDILNIVDQMRTSIPDEIKLARRIIQEKERIIAQAQADASVLLARAREESERAIKREGLLQAAGERSLEIMREAEERAEMLKTDADTYVTETLRALKDHLTNIEVSVSRTILSIEKGLESLEQPPDEEESVEGTFTGRRQAHAPTEEVEEVQPPAHSIPRRASLAADTMGGQPTINRGSTQQDLIPQASDADGQFGHTYPPDRAPNPGDGYPQGSPPRAEASSPTPLHLTPAPTYPKGGGLRKG